MDSGLGLDFALTFLDFVKAMMIIVKEDAGAVMILDSISISTLSICFGNFNFLI